MADFLLQAPREVLVRAIPTSKTEKRPYDDIEARTSLYLDIDRGCVHALSRYARQWQWPKQTVHNRWHEITHDVWMWASWNGEAPDNPVARKYVEMVVGTSKTAFDPGTTVGRRWDEKRRFQRRIEW